MAAGDGLVSMTPTSIAYSGTSASINADGGVDFSAVTSLSLNGVFTGDYDNYLIVWRGTMSAASAVLWRMRVSGSDSSTGYTTQYITAANTTLTVARDTGETKFFSGSSSSVNMSGHWIAVYGPYLTQPTVFRSDAAEERSGMRLHMGAGTHSVSTSYDGITAYVSGGTTMTGTVHVFGYEE